MLEKIKNFTSAHLDFKVYPVTWIAIANALLIVPCIMFLPKEFGYENGLLENIQLIALLVGFIICLLYPKYNKEESNEKPALVKFFRFAALVIVILLSLIHI